MIVYAKVSKTEREGEIAYYGMNCRMYGKGDVRKLWAFKDKLEALIWIR